MEEPTTSLPEDGLRRYIKAFYPFFFFLAFDVLILASHYHLKFAQETTVWFEVKAEEKDPAGPFEAKLDGKKIRSGNHAWPGYHELSVSMEAAVPLRTNRFLRYGSNYLGVLNLQWRKGTLNVSANPPPERLAGSGPRFAFTNAITSNAVLQVPTGAYRLKAFYPYFTLNREVTVEEGQVSEVTFAPQAGCLRLATDPAGSLFELVSTNGHLSVQGKTPSLLKWLPAGAYELTVQRSNYVQERRVRIQAHATNELHIPFAYGEIVLETDPAGAEVYHERRRLGATPLHIRELQPESYDFHLRLSNYAATNIAFAVEGGQSL